MGGCFQKQKQGPANELKPSNVIDKNDHKKKMTSIEANAYHGINVSNVDRSQRS